MLSVDLSQPTFPSDWSTLRGLTVFYGFILHEYSCDNLCDKIKKQVNKILWIRPGTYLATLTTLKPRVVNRRFLSISCLKVSQTLTKLFLPLLSGHALHWLSTTPISRRWTRRPTRSVCEWMQIIRKLLFHGYSNRATRGVPAGMNRFETGRSR